MIEPLINLFLGFGLDDFTSALLARGTAILVMLIVSFIADIIARRLMLNWIGKVVEKTKTQWDDYLLERKVFTRLAHLAPALIIGWMTPLVFDGLGGWIFIINKAVSLYVIIIILLVIHSVLNAIVDIYRTFPISKEIPIKTFVQVAQIIVSVIAIILIVSILIDQNPVVLLSGLGALSAVLIIVFKDSILGFVAGVQLAANKMISRGDWIEMPNYGADGDVLEVTLTTVKVQNWDKTITTIPTYALISDSFKNWRGMTESGGRRIKRSVNIDMSSIKFCDEEMLERFAKIQYISDYIQQKREEIKKHNEELKVDYSTLANGRHLTNIGTFRAYVIAYLRHHPKIHQSMTFLVRQLKPTSQGLPIEIYVFSSDQNWVNYEGIQADIFDHLLAVVPEFDLRVFQDPTGQDFQALSN